MPRSYSGQCSVDGCEGPVKARGWCGKHWQAWKRHGDPLAIDTKRSRTLCSVSGCNNPPRATGSLYCEMHYYRLRRNGSVENKVLKEKLSVCLQCGKTLTPRQYMFCCSLCSTRYYRGNSKTIACAACGREFTPKNMRMTTCSPECKRERMRIVARAYYKQRIENDPVFCAAVRAAEAERRSKLSAAEFVVYDYVYERDGYTCQLCGKPIDMTLRWPSRLSPSIDHIVPLSKGGEHTYANCQAAHLSCNCRKGAR